MRSVNNQAFYEHTRDMLLHILIIQLNEQVKQNSREMMSVVVRETKLVGHRIQNNISPLSTQLGQQALINLHRGRIRKRMLRSLPDTGTTNMEDERVEQCYAQRPIRIHNTAA